MNAEPAFPPLADRLHAYCQSAFPDRQAVAVRAVEKLPSGWESELYAFRLEHGPEASRRREALVLRLYAGDHAGDKAAHEFDSLRRLRQAGYPVPQAFVLERDQVPLGRPFVLMERVYGRSLFEVLFEAESSSRQNLLDQFCRLFVRLHRLDWGAFVDEAERARFADPCYPIDRWFAIAEQAVTAFDPIDFRPYLDWLGERRAALACPRPSPVHWDYHPNNVLLQENGNLVVIDWTGFRVTDPRHDLAWALMLADAYLGEDWRALILEGYERASGAHVDQIEAFEVCACLRRLYNLGVSMLAGPKRQGMLPETIERMKADRPAHRRVYARLVRHTGLRAPELKRLFG